MPTLKPCHFRGELLWCHTYQYMFLCYSSNTYNIITSINTCYSWRFHTTVKSRKYCPRMYHILFLLHGIYATTCDTGGQTSLRSIPLFLLHGIYTTTCDTVGQTSLRSIPPGRSTWCHVYRSNVVTVYQRTTNHEYCQCIGQYRIAHIRSVPPRPN